MRDEIRLLVGDRRVSLRDFDPGRYDSSSRFISDPMRRRASSSSMGSVLPLHSAPHQTLLSDGEGPSYLSSAWAYTLGMLSSLGAVLETASAGNDGAAATR